MAQNDKETIQRGMWGKTLQISAFVKKTVAACVKAVLSVSQGARSKLLVARSGFIRERLGKESVAIVTAGDHLRVSGGRLESAFTEIGGSLEKMSDRSGELVSKTEELINLAVGQVREDVKLDAAMEVVKRPLDYLEQSRTRTEDLIGMLENYIAQINRITSLQEEIRSAVGPLKYIQTLFKIESAPLPIEIQQIFVGLTKDIERLHSEVVSMFDRQFCLLRETQQTIRVVSVRLRETCARQKAITDENRTRIEVALANLQRDLERNQEHDIRISDISKHIAGEVGEMVIAMQVQDMVNQKLQHVREVFDEIIASIGIATSDKSRAEKAKALLFVAESARLQSAQLQGVDNDLVEARDKFKTGIRGVKEGVGELDQESLSLAEFTPVISCTDGMVQTLLDIIDEVRGMLASTVEYTGESYESIKPIGNVASDLTSTMRELSANVHLIALNAEIQAAQLGSGTGLEVLSARTTMVSNETNRISQEVASKLDQFGNDLVGIVDSFQRLYEEGNDQVKAMGEDGKAEELGLHAIRDFMLQALLDVDQLVKEVGEMTGNVERRVDQDVIDDGAVKEAKLEMDRIANLASECLKGALGTEQSSERLAEISARYSMDSQRSIHGAVISSAESTDDDGVELFGFDDLGEAPEKPQASAKNRNRVGKIDRNLGDNIELF